MQTWPGRPGVTFERDVVATMRDGTKLYADVYRPAGDAEVPVLLIRSPYDKRPATAHFGNAHPVWYAEHGYQVVVQDCRGRVSSEGEFYPYLNEQADGYDTVEWASSMPGGDGQVGMWGFSYTGATQLLAAVERPPGLRTIIPGFAASQQYEGWTYNGGALATAFLCYWASLLALDTAARAGDEAGWSDLVMSLGNAPDWFWHLPMSEFPPLQGGHAPYFYDWVEHCTYDDYWRRWSIDEDYSRIEVPALHYGGWYDVFLTGTVKNFVGLRDGAGSDEARAAQKLVLGPWTHMPWTPHGTHEADAPVVNDMDEWHIRWYDQILKGIDTGVLDHPVTVHLYNGGWRDFDDWPPPEAELVDWYLHSDGRANSKFGDGTLSRDVPSDEPSDVFIYDPGVPTVSLGGHSCCFDTITPMGPADQHGTEVSRMVLVYTAPPFESDVELVGNASVILHAATTARDTDWTARLCVVDAAGVWTNLQEGILRARYRNSLSTPELVEPDRVHEYTIDLGPVGAAVATGSSLRLQVASSDFPQWDRNLNTGGTVAGESAFEAVVATQTALHDHGHPSRLPVPIIFKA